MDRRRPAGGTLPTPLEFSRRTEGSRKGRGLTVYTLRVRTTDVVKRERIVQDCRQDCRSLVPKKNDLFFPDSRLVP